MPTPYQTTLAENLRKILELYVETFGDAAVFYGLNVDAQIEEKFQFYLNVITNDVNGILVEASKKIRSYMNQYKVRPNQTVDEYKCAYFLGVTISERLEKRRFQDCAKINLHSMILLLSHALKRAGGQRQQLDEAMRDLINDGSFAEEMGTTGCYLTYKCLSNAAQNRNPTILPEASA